MDRERTLWPGDLYLSLCQDLDLKEDGRRKKNGSCDLGQVLQRGAIWVMGRVSAGDRVSAVLEMSPVHRMEMSES